VVAPSSSAAMGSFYRHGHSFPSNRKRTDEREPLPPIESTCWHLMWLCALTETPTQSLADYRTGTISLTVFPAVSISRSRLPGIGRRR
jgi:hypothetical protein